MHIYFKILQTVYMGSNLSTTSVFLMSTCFLNKYLKYIQNYFATIMTVQLFTQLGLPYS